MRTKEKSTSKSTASTSTGPRTSGTTRQSIIRPRRKASRDIQQSAKRKAASSPSSGRRAANDAASSRHELRDDPNERITVVKLGEHLGEDRSNWARVDAFTEEEIERMAIEDGADDFDWTKGKLVMPRNKESIHLRIDPDILEWFKSQGPGHLTRINAVLRTYVDAQRK